MPDVEKGFIQIACGKPENDILLAIAGAGFTGTEIAVILCVIRRTWGWKKKEDWISLSQFVESTNRSRRGIVYAVNRLVQSNALVQKVTPGVKTVYSFNKNFSSWNLQLVHSVALVQKMVSTSAKNGKQLVQYIAPTKEIYTKEITTKETHYGSLKEIKEIDLIEIGEKYQVPLPFVRSRLDDMENWCAAKGRTYKNYKRALMNWVKSDAIKLKQEVHGKSTIGYVTTD